MEKSFIYLVLTIIISVSELVHKCESRTAEADQIILETMRALDFTPVTTEEFVPLYRLDLEDDYEAYYLMKSVDEYVITSAGVQTGDRDISRQGPLTDPVSLLDRAARKIDSACAKHIVLSPGGEMGCMDAGGVIILTDMETKNLKAIMKQGKFSTVDEYIKSRLEFLANKWEKHAFNLHPEPSDEGPDEGEVEPPPTTPGPTRREAESALRSSQLFGASMDPERSLVPERSGREVASGVRMLAISPEQPVEMVVGDATKVLKISLSIVPDADQSLSQDEAKTLQINLCRALSNCETTDSESTFPLSTIETDPTTQISYTVLNLSPDVGDILNGKQPSFRVDVTTSGDTISQMYGVMFSAKRPTRNLYLSWNSFTYRGIPDSEDFPSYHQTSYLGCLVGSINVAWGMIFGYYDRRSHLHFKTVYQGSKSLYRSGSNGFWGSNSKVAPASLDNRMKKYIRGLRAKTQTSCVNGQPSTNMFNIKDVEPFFKQRQTWWLPSEVYVGQKLNIFSLWGIHNSFAEGHARYSLAKGWPALIGYNKAWLSGRHYPVLSRYRYRYRYYKQCVNGMPQGNWRLQYDYDMYVRMGKQNNAQNGWYMMQAFYSASAPYYHIEG